MMYILMRGIVIPSASHCMFRCIVNHALLTRLAPHRYMDKISCWSALQPNHIETSSMLLTGINLFPPQEASYPTYVDFDAVIKGLERHKSRKRLTLLRKLKRKQDKYQLKAWDHVPGHQ